MPSDSENRPSGNLIVVEARDLDTDERSRESVAVDPPADSSAQRSQLSEVATRLHPSARMRSFANGAATFLDRQHLIVAFYADPVDRSRGRAREPATAQAALFA